MPEAPNHLDHLRALQAAAVSSGTARSTPVPSRWSRLTPRNSLLKEASVNIPPVAKLLQNRQQLVCGQLHRSFDGESADPSPLESISERIEDPHIVPPRETKLRFGPCVFMR